MLQIHPKLHFVLMNQDKDEKILREQKSEMNFFPHAVFQKKNWQNI